jgi:translation initiation factor 2 subunit 2
LWQGSERDYTYEELLTRVFNIMREKNPDYVTGEKRKFVMKPPQVNRVGTKKTSFTNFAEICKLLRRQEKHLLNFLLVELGTSGSLDINKQLTIKGKFQQKQIENVLRRYISKRILSDKREILKDN